jgi:hypothetical protein
MAVDDWRVAETWRTVQGKLAHATPNCQTELWILWRRIAGGLSPGQQQALFDPLMVTVRGLHRRLTTGKGGGDVSITPQQSIEMWRLLGALELLPATDKRTLGDMLVELMGKKSLRPARHAIVWALGRIGTRVPMYGPLNTLLPVDVILRWIANIQGSRETDEIDLFAVMQMARRTGDRYRDLDDRTRRDVLDWMQAADAPQHLLQLVRDGGALDREEQGRVFGEALPKGLRIQ